MSLGPVPVGIPQVLFDGHPKLWTLLRNLAADDQRELADCLLPNSIARRSAPGSGKSGSRGTRAM